MRAARVNDDNPFHHGLCSVTYVDSTNLVWRCEKRNLRVTAPRDSSWPMWENLHGNREIFFLNGGDVEGHGPLTRGSNRLSPKTKYKRLNNVFAVCFIAIILRRLGTELL